MTELNRPQQNPVKQNQGDQRPGRPDPGSQGNLERDPEDAQLQGDKDEEEIDARGDEGTAEGTERPNNVRNANLQKQGSKGRQQS